MSTIKSLKSIIIPVIAFVVLGMFSSCRKEEETIAIVTVVDDNGNAVSGVDVRLHYDGASQALRDGIEQTQVSGSDGQATFIYTDLYKLGQAGFAVLDVEIGAGLATGIIKIEPEKINEETIPCSAC